MRFVRLFSFLSLILAACSTRAPEKLTLAPSPVVSRPASCLFINQLPCAQVRSINEQRNAEVHQRRSNFEHGFHNPRYLKVGSQVSVEDALLFVEEFHPTYKEAMSWGPALLQAGAKSFSGRLKDPMSLHSKMHGRFAERFALNNVNDIVGIRAVTQSLEEQQKLSDWVYENFEVVVHLDYVRKIIKADGYRGDHFTLRASTGRLVELQILTEQQMRFANFTHDRIYKAKNVALKKDPRVQRYLKELSDTLYQRELSASNAQLPKVPAPLKKAGYIFTEI